MIDIFISLGLALFVVGVYWRTIRFGLIVDDVRHCNDVLNGLFQPTRMVWQRLNLRFYGVGTLARKIKCDHDEKAQNGKPCIRCRGTGYRQHVSLPIEHAFTVGTTALTCVLIYVVFGALGGRAVGAVTAVLYAVNPSIDQMTIWLNGRRYAVNIVLTLIMMLVGVVWGLPAVGLLVWLPTAIFQVNAVFAPVLLGGLWWLAIPAVIGFGWKRYREFISERRKMVLSDEQKIWHYRRLIVGVKSVGWYALRVFVPFRSLMVYPFLAKWGLHERGNKDAYKLDGWFWSGCVVLISVVAGLSALRGMDQILLLFATLATLQTCNWILSVQTAANRYIGLVIVFGMYAVARVGIALGPVGWALLGVYAGYCLCELWVGMRQYKDMVSFYDYHLFHNPADIVLRKFRINWLLNTKEMFKAWELVREGLEQDPEDCPLLYLAAVCLHHFGEADESNRYLDRVEGHYYDGQADHWRGHVAGVRAKNKVLLAGIGRNRVAMQPADWKGK